MQDVEWPHTYAYVPVYTLLNIFHRLLIHMPHHHPKVKNIVVQFIAKCLASYYGTDQAHMLQYST